MTFIRMKYNNNNNNRDEEDSGLKLFYLNLLSIIKMFTIYTKYFYK